MTASFTSKCLSQQVCQTISIHSVLLPWQSKYLSDKHQVVKNLLEVFNLAIFAKKTKICLILNRMCLIYKLYLYFNDTLQCLTWIQESLNFIIISTVVFPTEKQGLLPTCLSQQKYLVQKWKTSMLILVVNVLLSSICFVLWGILV